MQRVYALVGPWEAGQVRYVGQTRRSIAERLSDHCQEARDGQPGRLYDWIRGPLGAGLAPEALLLETVRQGQGQRAESYWIARMRAEGQPLFNHARSGRATKPEEDARVIRVHEAPFDWSAIDRDYRQRGI